MRFDSAEFLIFFAVVLVLHRTIPWRRGMLVFASYLFYASWNPPFLVLLLFTSFLDYLVAGAIERSTTPGRRRALLLFSMSCNLGILAYFKYVDFFLDNFVAVSGIDPAAIQSLYIRTPIPLGISFYTFQTMAYVIDVYRGQIRACRDPMDFALFITFFPQLIAGPIVRADEFLPQIHRNKLATRAEILFGIELLLVGAIKKVVIADTAGPVVDRCFGTTNDYDGMSLLVATALFGVQIFCDFDGYSTMARGQAKLLGYELPLNFDSPLLAGDPVEYRRRWHITMGTWFRDYLYRPLGGDRLGLLRTLINTLVVWTAFGLWHGASWTFILWGLCNGILLVVYRLLRAWRILPLKGRLAAWAPLGYLITPLFVGLMLILFRAENLGQAGHMLSRITTAAPGELSLHPFWGISVLALYALHWASYLWYREGILVRRGWTVRLTALSAALALLYLFGGSGQPFIYFQF